MLRIEYLRNHVDCKSQCPESSQLIVDGESQDRNIQQQLEVSSDIIQDWPCFLDAVSHVRQLVAHRAHLNVMQDFDRDLSCATQLAIVVNDDLVNVLVLRVLTHHLLQLVALLFHHDITSVQ